MSSPDGPNEEIVRLGGEWFMVSGARDGQPLPEALLESGKRVAMGNATTVTISGQVLLRATFTVDTSERPKAIDYVISDGPDKGKTQYGIYELDGDTLRFCFSAPGKDRPTRFTTKPGDGLTISEWKRGSK